MGWGEPKGPTIVELSHRDLIAYSELAVAARDFLARGTTGNRERLAAAVEALDQVPAR